MRLVGAFVGVTALCTLAGALTGALPAAASASAPGPRPDVGIVQTANGPVLADAQGATLYTYVDDLLTRAPSACTGDCANDWPPALVSGRPTVARGVTAEIGVVERGHGQHQLTVDGRPLYRFSGDRGRGDLRGNGVGNIWWAMMPNGLSATSFPLPPSTYAATPAPTTLTVVQTRAGAVVADDQGQVLYTYEDDTATKSACQADWCLVDWPPLQADGPPSAAAGITAPLTTLDGAGGTTQVALGGHPLYTFAGDLHPGDIRGQGVGGDWYLIAPDGNKVTTTTTTSAATAGSKGPAW